MGTQNPIPAVGECYRDISPTEAECTEGSDLLLLGQFIPLPTGTQVADEHPEWESNETDPYHFMP